MSLDNIQLSKKECQILFAKNLVGTVQDIVADTVSNEIKINSLGGNQKNILFLVNDSQNKFLPDNEMDLLSNLITACKLSMADIALVNHYNTFINYHQLTDHFQSKKILMFGATTSELGLPFSIPFFQIQQFQQQFYLTAPPLIDFLNNKNLKKDLWISLQKLFLLK
ncbi:MAG TPA: hypothetical protein VFI29_04885 [Hanamia sp.]|nr:hypothetical protein [Hanamia sp.]